MTSVTLIYALLFDFQNKQNKIIKLFCDKTKTNQCYALKNILYCFIL